MKYEFPGFNECIDLIKSEDPMEFEDGYHMLVPFVKNYSSELADLVIKECNQKIKSRLVELLSECKDPKYTQLFEELLRSGSPDVAAWALTALENMPTGDGPKIAKAFRGGN